MNKINFDKITDSQWELMKDFFPNPIKRGRGKPHTPWRYVLNSILYVLLCDVKWGAWPEGKEYASKSAAHRWFSIWDKSGLIQEIIQIVKSSQEELEIFQPQRRNRSKRGGIQELVAEEGELDLPLYFEMPEEAPAIPVYNK